MGFIRPFLIYDDLSHCVNMMKILISVIMINRFDHQTLDGSDGLDHHDPDGLDPEDNLQLTLWYHSSRVAAGFETIKHSK